MTKQTQKRSPSQVAKHRRKIAEMYLQGRYQEEIAEALGIAQSTVSRDIKYLLAEWREDAKKDIEQRKAELEQKYIHIWREANAAWLKSLEAAETTIQEMIENGGDAGIAGGPGRLKASTRKEGQSGNPALLAQAQAALKAIREMFGVDAATKISNFNYDLSKATDEQLQRIAAGDDPAAVLANPNTGGG